jgi:hypothetical protein
VFVLRIMGRTYAVLLWSALVIAWPFRRATYRELRGLWSDLRADVTTHVTTHVTAVRGSTPRSVRSRSAGSTVGEAWQDLRGELARAWQVLRADLAHAREDLGGDAPRARSGPRSGRRARTGWTQAAGASAAGTDRRSGRSGVSGVQHPPEGFVVDEDWRPDEWDVARYRDDFDLGTMYTDGAYDVLYFRRVNAHSGVLFSIARFEQEEGLRILALPLGADGDPDEGLPVLLVGRRERVRPPHFAVVQDWADALALIAADIPRREAGLHPEPVAPVRSGRTRAARQARPAPPPAASSAPRGPSVREGGGGASGSGGAGTGGRRADAPRVGPQLSSDTARLAIEQRVVRMEGDGEPDGRRRGLEVLMSGPTNFPRKGTAVTTVIEFTDVTDGRDVQPVLFATGTGEPPTRPAIIVIESTSPFIGAVARRASLATVPLGLLHAPQQGRRRLRIDVTIFATRRPEHALSHGSVELRYQEDKEGYLSLGGGLFSGDPDQLIGLIGVAASAVDGYLADIELRTIARFLAARTGRSEERARLEDFEVVAAAVRAIADGRAPSEVLDDACSGLRTGPLEARLGALELCVAVVTVDGCLTEEEGRLLLEVADRLALAASAPKARDDSELLHIFVGEDTRLAVGLPLGLSREDELVWLQRAWRTWNDRIPKLADRERRARAERLVEVLDRMMEERERG